MFYSSYWVRRMFLLAAASTLLTGCQVASKGMTVDGVRLHQQGNYQAAAARFMQAIATNSKDADAYYNLAATYHQTGRLQGREVDLRQAENYYNQCLDYNPNHTECYRALAVLLADTNRNDASVRLLEGWAARNPASADPKIELARVLEELGMSEKAVARLEEGLSVEPNNARALAALGRLREQSGDPDQALAVYKRSLAVNQYQPHVAARVASLQNTAHDPVVLSSPTGTRLVQEPSRLGRY